MTYLESIKFPADYKNVYPYGLPAIKNLGVVEFSPVTIFAGSNGSGKSTILNVIAEKMNDFIPVKKSTGNITGYFNWFAKKCYCKLYYENNKLVLPALCRLIKSEDIMEIINKRRKTNKKVEKDFKTSENYVFDAFKKKKEDFKNPEDYYTFNGFDEEMYGINKEEQELTDGQRFYRSLLEGQNYNHAKNSLEDEYSNGESSMNCFAELMIEDNSLYLLDEPENSLAPKLQLELIKLIEECTRYFNCQFIIATHSPFILSLGSSEKISANIYDLDNIPVCIKHWYELDNMKEYARLFLENISHFSNNYCLK